MGGWKEIGRDYWRRGEEEDRNGKRCDCEDVGTWEKMKWSF